MTSAGDGTPDRTPLWTFAASCGSARRMATASGADRGWWGSRRPAGTGGARGHACPTARRGRDRTKAERADRQRRESRGASRPPASPGRSVRTRYWHAARASDDPRRQVHGALRAPLTDSEETPHRSGDLELLVAEVGDELESAAEGGDVAVQDV